PFGEVDGEVPGWGGLAVPAGRLPGAVLDLAPLVAEFGGRLLDGERLGDVQHVPVRPDWRRDLPEVRAPQVVVRAVQQAGIGADSVFDGLGVVGFVLGDPPRRDEVPATAFLRVVAFVDVERHRRAVWVAVAREPGDGE